MTDEFRPMTEQELDAFYRGGCPFCSTNAFYFGPEGGMSRNVRCSKCQCELNVVLGVRFSWGQVLVEPKKPWRSRPQPIPAYMTKGMLGQLIDKIFGHKV